MRWDIFCRVIDNFGDIGVCWRLAAQLGAAGQAVRLWVDDPRALQWMAPRGAAGVQVLHWQEPLAAAEPGDVVVEAFGCDPPASFVARMAARAMPPLWLNLEYLSAQDYVERSHGLPSPQTSGPGRGLVKYFVYPGFTPRTGGLLREAGLLARRAAFDRDAWLASRGWARRAGERVVSLFCYPHAPTAQLATSLTQLDDKATLLLVAASVTPPPLPGSGQVRVIALPWLEQTEFDHLLWSADLNCVRGEDSLVRAIWAGAPMLWQIYPQEDGVHARKLQAFVERQMAGADPTLQKQVACLQQAWNGLAAWPAAWPDLAAWQQQCQRWRDALALQDELCSQLLGRVSQLR